MLEPDRPSMWFLRQPKADSAALASGVTSNPKSSSRLDQAPVARMSSPKPCQDPGIETDDELINYAQQNSWTGLCSCMMENYAMSVVNSELKVHGARRAASGR